jgi:hypothetical protein
VLKRYARYVAASPFGCGPTPHAPSGACLVQLTVAGRNSTRGARRRPVTSTAVNLGAGRCVLGLSGTQGRLLQATLLADRRHRTL